MLWHRVYVAGGSCDDDTCGGTLLAAIFYQLKSQAHVPNSSPT